MIDVIIPTYKPGAEFVRVIRGLHNQSVKINRVIIMNTEEAFFKGVANDLQKFIDEGFVEVHHILKQDFDHGNTRREGIAKSKADIFVMMTMDAVPADDKLIENLIRPLSDDKVAASYARQLPKEGASRREQITREFNYPDVSVLKSSKDYDRLGIKTFFCSNVCCAYSRRIYDKLGGFVTRAIFNEDMIYAGQAVKQGYMISYTAEAVVYHSHDYGAIEQFRRNVDLGISQADHPEVFDGFRSETEGVRMVKMVITRLIKGGRWYEVVPYVWISAWKLMGYRMGKSYKKLPLALVKACSTNPDYLSAA
ncbi:MAG: glycosyltransferase family 2 protein [Lachnospiraceae bacterium]|nr:glycosyltransferase family 2 protein [Lachnospiraceae bacterium]